MKANNEGRNDHVHVERRSKPLGKKQGVPAQRSNSTEAGTSVVEAKLEA
jgi:hypothetical protein